MNKYDKLSICLLQMGEHDKKRWILRVYEVEYAPIRACPPVILDDIVNHKSTGICQFSTTYKQLISKLFHKNSYTISAIWKWKRVEHVYMSWGQIQSEKWKCYQSWQMGFLVNWLILFWCLWQLFANWWVSVIQCLLLFGKEPRGVAVEVINRDSQIEGRQQKNFKWSDGWLPTIRHLDFYSSLVLILCFLLMFTCRV